MLGKQKITKFLQKRGKLLVRLFFVFLAVGSVAFYIGSQAQAQPTTIDFSAAPAAQQAAIMAGDFIVSGIIGVISLLLEGIIRLLGILVSALVRIFASVAQYGNAGEFAAQPEVIIGWQILRDTVNAFYIVVLIAIALATIFRFQAWGFRQRLPRLILSAILINFSRLICLLFINFSQSVMATFTASIQTGVPAFIIGLRLPAVMAFESGSLNGLFANLTVPTSGAAGLSTAAIAVATQPENLNRISLIIAMLIGIVLLLAVVVTLIAYVFLLIIRIVMLWLLMILSPVAFFVWGIPGGQAGEYWKQWLGEFTGYVIAGPLIVFFVYLDILFFINNTSSNYQILVPPDELPSAARSLITQPNMLIGYFIAIALLLMGYEMTMKLKIRGADWVSNRFNPNKVVSGAVSGVKRIGTGIQANAYKAAAQSGIPGLAFAVKPLYNLGKINDSLLKKEQATITAGEDAARDKAAAAGSQGNRFREMLLSAGAGKNNYFDEKGAFWHIPKTAVAAGLGTASRGVNYMRGKDGAAYDQTNDALLKRIDLADGRTNYLKTAQDMFNAGTLPKFSGLSQKSLNTGLQAAKLVQDSKSAATATDAAGLLKQADQLLADNGITGITPQEFESNMEDLEGLAESLGQAGFENDDTATIMDHATNFDREKDGFIQQANAAKEELRDRAQAHNAHRAASQAINFEKVRSSSKEMYDKGKNYDTEDYVTDMESAMKDKKPERFMAAVIKAAENGKLGDVYSSQGQEYSFDGIEAVHDFNMNEAGLTKEQSFELIEHLDQMNASAGRHSQAHMTKKSRYKGLELLAKGGSAGQKAHLEAAAKAFARDFRKTLAGKSSGVLVQKKDGSKEIDAGFIEAVKKNPKRFAQTLSNVSPDSVDPELVKKLQDKMNAEMSAAVYTHLTDAKQISRAENWL